MIHTYTHTYVHIYIYIYIYIRYLYVNMRTEMYFYKLDRRICNISRAAEANIHLPTCLLKQQNHLLCGENRAYVFEHMRYIRFDGQHACIRRVACICVECMHMRWKSSLCVRVHSLHTCTVILICHICIRMYRVCIRACGKHRAHVFVCMDYIHHEI